MNIGRKLLAFSVLAALTVASPAHPHHDDEEHTEWLPRAELQRLFPQATDFAVKHVHDHGQFGPRVQTKLKRKVDPQDLAAPMFTALRGGKPLGWAWAGEGKFQTGATLVMVALDTGDRVVGVLVPDSKLAVARAPYLAQFKGKRASDGFQVGKDLKTTAAPAGDPAELARAVRQGAVMLSQARLEP